MTTERSDVCDIVVNAYDEAELFLNDNGDLVFQRKGYEWETEEACVAIVIPRGRVKAVSKRMLELLKDTKHEFDV